MSFNNIIEKYRRISFTEHDKGARFERLIQAYFLTDPTYAYKLEKVWLWDEFPGKNELGVFDTGIDLVALTVDGDYWAIQCKCYQENATIDKPAVDSFLSTSSRIFKNEAQEKVGFTHRFWVSTTNKWGPNATEAIKNQNPPVTRINLTDLQDAPIDWSKLENGIHGEIARNAKKTLRDHQKEALEKTNIHFKTADRGKLIMACGTGKTFNSLRIAENETNGTGLILFLVPSIALLGQTLRAWTADAVEPINAICICSDPAISKTKTKNEDNDSFSVIDLAFPASTNTKDIIRQFNHIKTKGNSGLTVVFSTYQSIDVIAKAQKEIIANGFGEFDLIICDEAHRTTGVTLANSDESAFVKVHDNEFIKGKKRLYMTATPRLFDADTKSKAAQADAVLCSMDEPKLFGEEIYHIGFGRAVELDLLTDYKVLILTLSDQDIPPAVQNMIADTGNEINTDDAAKLIGCINALSKQMLGNQDSVLNSDPEPMKRAIAFCANIKASQKITTTYNTATSGYINSLPLEQKNVMVSVASKHIDGAMGAPQRDELLGWLKADVETNECKILTNVRCLSEGVDVPSLDAVLFLSARNSQVDVVQSVGRVMRRAPGKNYGYIIIPVVVPSDIDAATALDNNDRYKVVWTVLNALRAHDDRFNATINKIELNKTPTPKISVVGVKVAFDDNGNPIVKVNPDNDASGATEFSKQLAIQFEQLQGVVFARMVNKVGDRRYWEQWAKNVAEIAERQVERITRLVTADTKHKQEFENFLGGLQKNINPSISQHQAIEMLSQHIITKPVFEALFDGYSFVKNNPISVSMQTMLELLEDQSFDKDAETLQKFYESVKMRASGIDNAEGKQRIIIELYDKFFKTAFPKMVEQLGIVYTPVECVDFIIHSVNDILQKEFGRCISDENVHVLDPFTGTGTFITRLFQSGLIKEEDLERKYRHEIHANEIVLLAYYIAAVNIENAFHDQTLDPDDGIGKEKYIPFDGIVLTDTFQLGETDGSERLFSEMFTQNSERVERQKKAPLRVIIGNPPYSIGQKSANDNAQNQNYEKLDKRIASTYAESTSATNKNSLYDSYIKSFRWSTDRLDPLNGGIIAFISNGSWIDGNATSGFRKCLENEFTSIYVFNLRGNARTSGELRQKEGGGVFGLGSRTPIAITLLVKNPKAKNKKANIHYHVIGDYLSREEKLSIVKKYSSIDSDSIQWQTLTPNEHGDWISQRCDAFSVFTPLGDKDDKKANTFFVPYYSNGLKTQRDAWCYNSSELLLKDNIKSCLDFYNEQRSAYHEKLKENQLINVKNNLIYDSTKISWTRALEWDIEKNKVHIYGNNNIVNCCYRPFFKQHLYYSRSLNEMVYQIPKLFPTPQSQNLLICVSGLGGSKENTTIMSNLVPDLNCLDSGTQCFPLYYYEERKKEQKSLFDTQDNEGDYIRHDGVSDFILDRATKLYGKGISKEDIFYYVYGFLHSPDYRELFANDLKKMLPRLPLVEDVRDFWAFSKAGRKLADLHLNYETVPPYDGVEVNGAELLSFLDTEPQNTTLYRVEKMRYPKKGQKETIIYNSKISIVNIPLEAYDYVVNGKSAIDWIMERYQVTVHKDSQIKNDPNDWATEVGNPRYILDLLLSIINVSMQTVDIVDGLPKVSFE